MRSHVQSHKLVQYCIGGYVSWADIVGLLNKLNLWMCSCNGTHLYVGDLLYTQIIVKLALYPSFFFLYYFKLSYKIEIYTFTPNKSLLHRSNNICNCLLNLKNFYLNLTKNYFLKFHCIYLFLVLTKLRLMSISWPTFLLVFLMKNNIKEENSRNQKDWIQTLTQ